MKAKILQIVLGAIGSIVTILISSAMGTDPDLVTAAAGGVAANGALGDAVDQLLAAGVTRAG